MFGLSLSPLREASGLAVVGSERQAVPSKARRGEASKVQDETPSTVDLDVDEHARWRRTASEKLLTAELLRDAGRHADACVTYEQVCQLGLKAVLRGLGLQERHHDLDLLAGLLAEEADAAVDDELSDGLKALARDYIPARYPDAYAEGTPDSHYTGSDARRAARTAELALAWVDATWKSLLLAAAADHEGEPD